MRTSARHPLFIGLFMTVLVGSLGCAHTVPPVRSEPVGTPLGRIGVAAAQDPLALALPNKPARGGAAGAGRGALTGFVGAIMAGAQAGQGGGFLVAFSPGFAVLGAIIGAAMAPSAAAVDEAETALTHATQDLKSEAIQAHVMGVAQSYPPHTFVLLPPSDPASRDKDYYCSLSREGVNAALEITQLTIALKGDGPINPSLKLSITANTNLIRTEDGTFLYTGPLEAQGGTRTFAEWGANEAQAFREEVDHTIVDLAKVILTHLFGPESSPASQSESPFTLVGQQE